MARKVGKHSIGRELEFPSMTDLAAALSSDTDPEMFEYQRVPDIFATAPTDWFDAVYRCAEEAVRQRTTATALSRSSHMFLRTIRKQTAASVTQCVRMMDLTRRLERTVKRNRDTVRVLVQAVQLQKCPLCEKQLGYIAQGIMAPCGHGRFHLGCLREQEAELAEQREPRGTATAKIHCPVCHHEGSVQKIVDVSRMGRLRKRVRWPPAKSPHRPRIRSQPRPKRPLQQTKPARVAAFQRDLRYVRPMA